MKEREPERNESTDEAVWLDLVSRLQNMPADETHGGRSAPSPPAAAGVDGPKDEPAAGDRHDTGGTGGLGEADSGPAAADGAGGGPVPRSAAERTRAIFENQPFRTVPPRGPRDYDEPEELESEGEFVPPEPPPFSTGEPLVVLAWTGALGGPILLLLFAMFWRGAPVAVILGVIVLFVAAAGYLLFRLPQHHDDDGAAV
ncbi:MULTISPECIES: hypothetical protein [unclassified Arthrobacter]|uniref:hypothetical protein n=1 Tax=unclassified Arthrobacter TaxID=235627 RepID=UPI000CE57389|nr:MULTISPECIES: hypothetical protein [unclassified Arthrobacter]